MKKIFFLVTGFFGCLLQVVAQNVGIGNTNPAFILDVSNRMRIRSGGNELSTAGIWLNNNANNNQPAFIGMRNDNLVGFFGSTSPNSGWGLTMNTTNGRVGIGIDNSTATLQVADSAVLFTGPLTIPPSATSINLPAEGAGTRMMWFPALGAFRAGYVDDFQWDKIAIGRLSFAVGWNSRAEGDNSTAMGHETIALGTYSTAIGNNTFAAGFSSVALGNGTSSSGNSSFAAGANSFASGSGSVAIGNQAEASGIFSVAFGYNTIASGQYGTAMGAGTRASGENSTACGGGTEASGNTSFAAGDGTIAKAFAGFSIGTLNDNADNPDPLIQLPDDRIFQVGNGNNVTRSNAITVLRNGNTGIGTTSPSQKLQVTGNICATGTIGACSDIRYKTALTPIRNCLSSLLSLHGIYYFWKRSEFPSMQFSDDRQLGFSAQEVEKIFPEVVMTDATGYKSVDYGRLTPVLAEAIKEQQQQIAELKKENEEIKKVIKILLKKIN